MMRTKMFVAVLCLTFVGCDGPGPPPGASVSSSIQEAGPHGGVLLPLPDQKGVVEISLEARSAGSRQTSNQILVARFLLMDLKSAIEPPPGDVSVKLEFPGRAPESISLKPDAGASSRRDPGRFVSVPGDYAVDPMIGELKASFEGRELAIPFTNGR